MADISGPIGENPAMGLLMRFVHTLMHRRIQKKEFYCAIFFPMVGCPRRQLTEKSAHNLFLWQELLPMLFPFSVGITFALICSTVRERCSVRIAGTWLAREEKREEKVVVGQGVRCRYQL